VGVLVMGAEGRRVGREEAYHVKTFCSCSKSDSSG
jgi:hypothetical protein